MEASLPTWWLFSDEPQMCIYNADGRKRLYRRPGEWYAQTELVIVERVTVTDEMYIIDILTENAVPYKSINNP